MENNGDCVSIILPIEPTGQQRPRFTRIGRFHKAYKSSKQKSEESKILALLYQYKPEMPIKQAVEVKIWAYLPIPRSWPKWKRKAALNGEIRPDKKPDIDNLAKQVLDCMNGVFWQDDKQVVSLAVEKWYSDQPRWVIAYRVLPEVSRR